MRRTIVVLSMIHVLAAAAACAGRQQLAFAPDALRDEVRRRAPGWAPADLVIPFELDAARIARARAIVAQEPSDARRARALAAALFDPGAFALRYSPVASTTGAEETLRRSEGNCLDLASVFVGLARSVGLRAYYLDASAVVQDLRDGADDLTVRTGHITAMVESEEGQITLDFDRDGTARAYRTIGDLEALAHFYNNRGFERIDVADESIAPDWVAAARDFRRAVEIVPGFARAWNNLGIAAVRAGRDAEAIADYGKAIEADSRMAAPHNNLGLVLLRRGQVRPAIRELEVAAGLAPRAYDVHYHLAVARLRGGDSEGAREALVRAISLRGSDPDAQSLLDRLDRRAAAR